jgi:hypothetical protein
MLKSIMFLLFVLIVVSFLAPIAHSNTSEKNQTAVVTTKEAYWLYPCIDMNYVPRYKSDYTHDQLYSVWFACVNHTYSNIPLG